MPYIKSLGSSTFEQLYGAFSAAFADYEVQLKAEQFRSLLQRRGFVPELSFGAFDDDSLVSFTFNGIGLYKGEKIAYDTGTGTLKEYRGKGLAGEIFRHSLAFLRKAGVTKYLLEVLKRNKAAIAVYRRQGFETVREFSYFNAARKNITLNCMPHVSHIRIENSTLNKVREYRSWMDFHPSWQNDYESIERQIDAFVIKMALVGNIPVGYCIFESASGDITQIAVDPDHRRKGISTLLLAEVLKESPCEYIKLINTDNKYPGLCCWAESTGLEKRGEQFEMIKVL